MLHEECELFKMIPKDEIKRVFTLSETASAEMDYSFFCFEEVYKAIRSFVPKSKTIIDLGCSYAAQSYYFKDYIKYIGVDCGLRDGIHFQTSNMEFYDMSIQKFCELIKEQKWDLENVFAICSYVPDKEAQELVRKTFPYCLVYYPCMHN